MATERIEVASATPACPPIASSWDFLVAEPRDSEGATRGELSSARNKEQRKRMGGSGDDETF